MQSLPKSERVLAFSVLAFAVAVGIIGIQRPLYIDEAFSVLASGSSLHGLIGQLRNDNSLPLYYLLLHGWIGAFGSSEIATRTLSVLFYLAAIVTAYYLGSEVSGEKRVGLYSAFLYAVSLQAIHIAQHVRMYSLLGFVAALSTLVFFRCVSSETPFSTRDWILFTAINLAGSFVHLWFGFLLLAELLCCAVFYGWAQLRRVIGSVSVAAGIWALLWGRFFLEQIRNGSSGWMPKIDLWSAPGLILEFYGGKYIGAAILAGCATLAIVGLRGGKILEPPTDGNQRRTPRVLLFLLAITITAPLLVSIVKPIYYLGRYSIIALPLIAVLIAWTLATRVRGPALAGFACVVMVLVMTVHVSMRNDVIENSEFVRTYEKSDKHAADQIGAQLRPGDTVVFTGLSRASVEYYFRRRDCERGANLISYPAVNADHLGWAETRLTQASLESEGDRLASHLVEVSRTGTSHIFIVPDDPVTSAILSRSMQRQLSQPMKLK